MATAAAEATRVEEPALAAAHAVAPLKAAHVVAEVAQVVNQVVGIWVVASAPMAVTFVAALAATPAATQNLIPVVVLAPAVTVAVLLMKLQHPDEAQVMVAEQKAPAAAVVIMRKFI